MSDGTNVSIKTGGGFEAPWLVFYGTVDEIGSQLVDAFGLSPSPDDTLVDLVVEAAKVAQGRYVAGNNLGGQPVDQGPPAQQAGRSWGSTNKSTQTAPSGGDGGGPGGSCEHGVREWKDFRSKAGNQVKGWFCPKGISDCSPKWAS